MTIYVYIPSDHIQKPDHESKISLYVPARIEKRWLKLGNSFRMSITTALATANISPNEFKHSWRMVQPKIPKEELFNLFKKAFSERNNCAAKVHFIRDVVQRYKAMKEQVWDASIVSVCSLCPPALCIHLIMLLRRCTTSCPRMHTLSH